MQLIWLLSSFKKDQRIETSLSRMVNPLIMVIALKQRKLTRRENGIQKKLPLRLLSGKQQVLFLLNLSLGNCKVCSSHLSPRREWKIDLVLIIVLVHSDNFVVWFVLLRSLKLPNSCLQRYPNLPNLYLFCRQLIVLFDNAQVNSCILGENSTFRKTWQLSMMNIIVFDAPHLTRKNRLQFLLSPKDIFLLNLHFDFYSRVPVGKMVSNRMIQGDS